MKIVAKISIVLTALCFAVSCTELSEFSDKLDKIESRVAALEKVTELINENISALKALSEAGSINSCSEKDGVYTLVLSNGETITLTQGSIGSSRAPIMSVDEAGFWMVDYQDGKGSVYIMCNGEKVQSRGNDGKTPLFRVSDDDCWQVSYDGVNYSYVLDANGQKVKCISDGEIKTDTFFNNVTYDEKDNLFTLELKNGTILKLPVISDFLCSIDAEGMQIFNPGETKNYAVTLKGVSATTIIAPERWGVNLSENILSVTAPEVATKSAMADNRTDVSIIAFSGTGYTAVAKLSVIVDGEIPISDPAIIPVLGEVTYNSAVISVSLSNATGWKYLLQDASTPAPTVETINNLGLEGEGKSVTLSGLEEETSYVAYFIAVRNTVSSVVKTLPFTTTAVPVNSYYEEWMAGKTIKIGGVKYGKDVWSAEGACQYVDADLTLTDGNSYGVYFLAPGVTLTLSFSNSCRKLFVIGDKPGQKPTVKFTTQIQFYEMGSANGNNVFAFKNVNVDATNPTNYIFKCNNAKCFDRLVFDDCYIRLYGALYYDKNDNHGIKDVTVVNSDIEITNNGTQIFNLNALATGGWESVRFENNLIYSSSKKTNFYILQTTSSSKFTLPQLIIRNNTIANLHSKTEFYCHLGTVNNVVISNNIIYHEDALSDAEGFLRCRVAYPQNGTVKDNIWYTASVSSHSPQVFFGGKANWFTGLEEAVKLDDSPFSSIDYSARSFKKTAECSGYGANR